MDRSTARERIGGKGHQGHAAPAAEHFAVHVAARVGALAGPGEVFVSAVTRDLLEGSDPSFEESGVHELKGLSGTRPVFALTARP